MRLLLLTALAMLAFAANSLLCRLALAGTAIEPASFTSIRLTSGALVLWLVVWLRERRTLPGGTWASAAALFAYAAAFSFAYISLPTGVGALLLFGAVQTSMIVFGLARGEKLSPRQAAGFLLALGGLLLLVRPGLTAPPLAGSLLMLCAGVAWGVYSLRGRGAGDPTLATAGNFLRAAPMALALSLAFGSRARLDRTGAIYALLSGAVTSGLGYVIWYTALKGLSVTRAAVVQLSVPVIAALGGTLLLGEAFTFRLGLASLAILGGIALVVVKRPPKA
jgi:drug/metabolite transporter (DMT)-like permease